MPDIRNIDMLVCIAHAKLKAAKAMEMEAVGKTHPIWTAACKAMEVEVKELTDRINEYRKAGVD